MKKITLNFSLILLILVFNALTVFAQDGEFLGQFEPTLVADTEDLEQVVFNPALGFKQSNISADAHIVSGKFYSPITERPSISVILAEVENEKPALFLDSNNDGNFSDNEKITMKREEPKNPYLWIATLNLPLQDKVFTSYQVFVRYFRDYRTKNMAANDRLFQQSQGIYARGKIDMNGKPVLVQYAYNFAEKKINPQVGEIGVDTDGDGEIYMDRLSPEFAKAKQETVVFRIGQTYISTKKADLAKNQIVLKTHKADDYKRIELAVGNNFPAFQFTDLYGKKHSFDEFKGKYVLIDIWGFWCPPCQEELPYLREAYKRFQGRNFEIVGLNTDEDFTTENIRTNLEKSDLKWTQAEFSSVVDLLKKMRISSFPTTILVSPEGKILSMGRTDKNETDLRGKDLLETLDEVLPEK